LYFIYWGCFCNSYPIGVLRGGNGGKGIKGRGDEQASPDVSSRRKLNHHGGGQREERKMQPAGGSGGQ